MAKNMTNNMKKLTGQLTAEKKKIAIAVVLVVFMVFMWVKVLTKSSPSGTRAAVIADEPGRNQQNKATKITFLNLPELTGRHDVLRTDFFDARDWKAFKEDKEGDRLVEVEENGKGDNEKDEIVLIARELKLSAILPDDNPRAFINGTLVSIGGKLSVKQGDQEYEFEVVAINNDNVVIKCETITMTIKMNQNG